MHSVTRRSILLGSLSVGAAALAAGASPSAHADVASTDCPVPGLTDVLGTYGRSIREAEPRADGVKHIDTPAQIAELQQLHVNTFAYLIYLTSQADWDDLVTEFLPAAQEAGINVWVYLVPPSEAKGTNGYPPFGYTGDAYIDWAVAIANLSTRFSVLTAWVVDDFDSAENLTLFTPAYTEQMHDAARTINAELSLFTILYPGQYTDAFLDDYAAALEGAILPYTGNASRDLNDLSGLRPALDAAASAMGGRGKRLYLMPYASKLSASPTDPSARAVADTIQVGLDYQDARRIDGVMLYQSDGAGACGVSRSRHVHGAVGTVGNRHTRRCRRRG